MRVAHIRNGQIIKEFGQEKGWFELENGDKVSPPQNGFVNGNDKIVPMIEEVQDTSTGTVGRVSTDTGWQVEADRVYRLRTIRDKTPQEITADEEVLKDRIIASMDLLTVEKALEAALWHLHNGSVPNSVNTPDKFRTWLRSLL